MMRYISIFVLLTVLGCTTPTPVPTPPAPPPELHDLPKQAWADRGLIAWELPAIPFDSNSGNSTTGERLGHFVYGAEVTIEKYTWSVPEQKYWIYLKQNEIEGWVPFVDVVFFDGPPQAEISFQALQESIAIPAESTKLRTVTQDGREIHDLGSACVQTIVYGTMRPIADVVQEFHDESVTLGWDFSEIFNIRSEHYITMAKRGIGSVLLSSLNEPLPEGYALSTENLSDISEYATLYGIKVSYSGPVSGCGWED